MKRAVGTHAQHRQGDVGVVIVGGQHFADRIFLFGAGGITERLARSIGPGWIRTRITSAASTSINCCRPTRPKSSAGVARCVESAEHNGGIPLSAITVRVLLGSRQDLQATDQAHRPKGISGRGAPADGE